jgi:hypothetical protein
MEQKSSEMHAEVYSEDLARRNRLGDDNNETDLIETECKNVDWIQLASIGFIFRVL